MTRATYPLNPDKNLAAAQRDVVAAARDWRDALAHAQQLAERLIADPGGREARLDLEEYRCGSGHGGGFTVHAERWTSREPNLDVAVQALEDAENPYRCEAPGCPAVAQVITYDQDDRYELGSCVCWTHHRQPCGDWCTAHAPEGAA